MKRVLWLMSGVPGSGKSYWAKKFIAEHADNSIWISRDAVRFSFLKDEEEYFTHETKVFNTFVDMINAAIDNGTSENIIVDATHLNAGSRKKILKKLHTNNMDIKVVVFKPKLQVCLDRNSTREGRARVPDDVIRNMWNQQTDPKFDVPFIYNEIIYVIEDM